MKTSTVIHLILMEVLRPSYIIIYDQELFMSLLPKFFRKGGLCTDK